jgi:hypothetical protein
MDEPGLSLTVPRTSRCLEYFVVKYPHFSQPVIVKSSEVIDISRELTIGSTGNFPRVVVVLSC